VLAIGAGGLEVALAMAGQPFHVKMPKIWGVKLVGTLPDWVSAKDVILEMLRRHFLSRFSRRLRRRLFGGCLLESLLCSHSVFIVHSCEQMFPLEVRERARRQSQRTPVSMNNRLTNALREKQ
jgi:hypothetical protein